MSAQGTSKNAAKRPTSYRRWLSDCQTPICDSTIRSRESTKIRKLSSMSAHVDNSGSERFEDQNMQETDGDCDGNSEQANNVQSATASSTNPNCSTLVHDELVPGGNSPISSGSDVTKNHLVLILMSLMVRHSLTSACMTDLLAVMNLIVPGCVPKTLYYFEKFTRSRLHDFQRHFYCSQCNHYFGTTAHRVCTKCQHACGPNSEPPYMLVLPLKDQLQELLQQNDWEKYIFNGVNSGSSVKRDVNNGTMYGKLKGTCSITLQFNCDGAPLYKSSAFSIWPLTCLINELPVGIRNKHPILHTLWFGQSKPSCHTYLKPFIDEIASLSTEGINWHGIADDFVYSACVSATLCICDAPARAMVQEIMQYNGFYGCGFCYHSGQRVEKGRGFVRVYPMDSVVELRNHSDTINLAAEAVESGKPVKGVKGVSPLLLLPNFDIVESVVPEYMHSILLGVTRQFINIWTDSANNSKEYFLKNLHRVDDLLVLIKPPTEVKRLPRKLSDVAFWKASEFRHFLLLYSPVVLRDVLPRKYYAHWLLLVNGVTLLLRDDITADMVNVSRACLNKFIVLVSTLYGNEFVSYNVHCLSHMPDAVNNWGPLWAHSAFVYEDVIRFLKTQYHGTQPVPNQLLHRFCTWKSLQHVSGLLIYANDEVKYLYRKLTKYRRSVSTVTRSGSFVGLGKAVSSRPLHVTQQIAIQNCLGLNASDFSKCEWFDRFVINGTLISTCTYSSNFKRSDCILVLDNQQFVKVSSAVVMKNCACSSECHCPTKCVLFVNCYDVCATPCISDHFVGMNLSALIFKVCEQAQTKAILCDSVVSKGVLISGIGGEFIMKLPIFEFE